MGSSMVNSVVGATSSTLAKFSSHSVPSHRGLAATLAALAALALAAPAQATVVNISFSSGYPAGTGFNIFDQTVVLPVGFTGAVIHIDSVFANDAAVLQVNGVNIVGWGIFGPGNGRFAFSGAGPFVPFTFDIGHGFSPATVNLNYTAPFVVGNNLIRLIHNDNGAGINGSAFSVANGEILFNGNVSFNTSTITPTVPEPSSLWLLLAAGGGLGVVRRKSLI